MHADVVLGVARVRVVSERHGRHEVIKRRHVGCKASTHRVTLETLKDSFESAIQPVLDELTNVGFRLEVRINKGVVFEDLYGID